QLRKVLAYLNSRDVGRDWLKRPANFGGRVRFEVKGIEMRRTTQKIDQNARACPAVSYNGVAPGGFGATRSGHVAGIGISGHRQTAACHEEFATVLSYRFRSEEHAFSHSADEHLEDSVQSLSRHAL